MVTFIDRAGHVASAICPVEIGLSYCQKNASPNVASCVRGLSIIASPIDYLIQVAVTPIWIIYDDLRSNSTLPDWLFTPLRLPGKILLGTVLCVIIQFLEGIKRIKDIYNSTDFNELHHEYKGKWTWLTQSHQPQADAANPPAITVFANRVLDISIRQQIERLILPTLQARNYTHFYILRTEQGRPPMLFEDGDGHFTDHPMPNNGRSSFLLLAHRSWESDTRQELTTEYLRAMQPTTSEHVTDERTGFIFGPREFLNLQRYDVLPLRVLEKIQRLPIYRPNE